MSEDRTQQLPDDGVKLILARLDSLDARMTALEEKVDRRLQETRPIWEQVLSRLDGIESRLEVMEGDVKVLRRKFRAYIQDQAEREERHDDLKEDLEEIDKRVSLLESKPAP